MIGPSDDRSDNNDFKRVANRDENMRVLSSLVAKEHLSQFHSVEKDRDWIKKVRNQQMKMLNVYATLLRSDMIHTKL